MTELRPGEPPALLESSAKIFCREHPRAAAFAALLVLTVGLLAVYAASPGELGLEGDLGGATIRVDGDEVPGPVARVWPSGTCEVVVKRPGFEDFRTEARVSPLSRVTIPVSFVPLPPPAPEPPPAPITEEEIAAEVKRLETATEGDLLAAVPATQRDASISRDAATRAFARCRAAGQCERSVLVFAPACAWFRRHPGSFASDPWIAALAAADLAAADLAPPAAARALLCAGRLALVLGRADDARGLFNRIEAMARQRAFEGEVDEAKALTEEALAASPPDGPREKLRELLEMCRQPGR